MRKRTIIALSTAGFVVVVGTIAGISGSPTPQPTGIPTPFTLPTSKVTTAPDPEPTTDLGNDPVTLDTAFELVMSQHFDADQIQPAKRVAKSFCGLLDTGMSFNAAAATELGLANQNNISANDIGTIMGAAVPAYCPEYRADLDAFVAANQ